jgi:ABC-2 type transport system ATP-binding protein
MAAIETQALERSFGELRAVAGVDLEVASGEIYAFLGPNGAGKTTTVRMLTTLLRPSAGTARVAGHDVVAEPGAVRREIGVALQEAALDPLMTGAELIRLQATLHGMSPSDGRWKAAALLERVGLVAAANRRIGTYSGGMRRRLDLAAALVHEPRVLFLDEPTTGLDPASRQAIWSEIRNLNAAGTTVFLTTQYLEEADQVAHRVGIIDDGRMKVEGTPAALKARVGIPHLELSLADGAGERAAPVLARFGEIQPPRDGIIQVGLAGGAAQIPAVVRALDEAGLAVESLELVQPTLDDVFLAETGRHLEGAGDDAATEDVPPPGPAASGPAPR